MRPAGLTRSRSCGKSEISALTMPCFALTYQLDEGVERGMTGENRRQFRVVGGNEALVRSSRVCREARWPPLRVVGVDEEHEAVTPPPVPVLTVQQTRPMQNRAAWSQALLAGLVVVMLSSVGQAIAANW
jgi:hypothetical protein